MVPKALQAQAIAIAHEGHQQTDGTLRMLRETQWFRNMQKLVKDYVESCKCQAALKRSMMYEVQEVSRFTERF